MVRWRCNKTFWLPCGQQLRWDPKQAMSTKADDSSHYPTNLLLVWAGRSCVVMTSDTTTTCFLSRVRERARLPVVLEPLRTQ